MNEEELREALKKLRVEDVLLQTAATLIDLAARRMGLVEDDGPKQLDQAKLAIDAVRALHPLMTDEQQAAVRDPLAQLQIGYARAAAEAAPDSSDEAGAGAPAPKPEPASTAATPPTERATGGDPKPDDEAERAKARSKIWTPPGV